MATNSNILSKSGIKGNKWHLFKTHWFSKSAISKLRRSKRALLLVVLLASSAAALTSLGVWRAVRPAPSLAHGATAASPANKAYEPPATADLPLTKLREYVYAGGRLVTSEEKSCVPTLSPASASSPQGGGTGSFSVSTASGCNWTAVSNAGWITVTPPTSGVGNGTVNYSVAANGGAQRIGTITVNGQAFTVTQDPNPASCSYSLNITSVSVSEQAGSGSFTLTTGGGCPWTAVSNATSWLTVTSAASGAGPATISYSVAANSGQQRVGVITVGGQTFTVTQDPNPASCTFALSPGSQLVGVGGGSGSFNVTTGAGCRWDAATTDGWITITGGATGTGNGTVSFTVQANNGGSRTGSISVRGQVFTITQCGYVVSPTSASFLENGGSGSVTVSSVAAGCSWSAASNASWITITSGASGSGNGSVNYTVEGYYVSNGERFGSLTVAGRTVTIDQSGPVVIDPPPCCINPPFCICLTALDPSASGANPRGLTARYFGNATLSGQPALERTDHIINFNWDGASPDKLLPADGFSVRWNGQIAAPSSEAYTFYLYSDGGARLWVNSQLVIDRWQPPFKPHTRSAPVDLKAGEKADIRVEYYDGGGKATIHLLWSSASTRKQIIPQRHLYPEAATNKSTSTDTSKQTGTLLPPGSDVGPKAARSQPSEWLASPLSRAGLVLLIACGVVALLLRTGWRQARRRFAMSAAGVVSRLRDQIASRLGELFRIAAAATDKLQFVAVFGKRLLAGACDKLRFADFGKRLLAGTYNRLKFAALRKRLSRSKIGVGADLRVCPGPANPTAPGRTRRSAPTLRRLILDVLRLFAGTYDKLNVAVFGRRLFAGASDKLKFVGHYLAAFSPIFKVVSRGVVVIRLGKQKLARLLPERVRTVAGRALSLWRSSGVARLKPILRRALAIAMIVILATPLSPTQADGLARAARATWRTMSAAANRYGASSDGGTFDRLIKALGKRPGKAVSAAAQAQQVTNLQVCPTQHVMFVGECYTFTPVALDSSNKVVHGAAMSWSSPNTSVAEVSSFGEVEAVGVGTTTVTVQSGNVTKQITIEVRSGTRPPGSNQQADLDPHTDCGDQQASMFAPQSAAGAPAQQSLIGADGVLYDWNPDPVPGSLATHFRNAVGNPRFTASSQSSAAVPTSTQLGSYNYQFNVPVVSVGGRGVGANIGMTLNSRVWNTDNGKLTFNYVGAYPGPGWSMGYGKIIRNYNATATGDKSGIGSGNSPGDYLLVAGDGTRVRLAAKYDTAAGRWFHESDDGSFLKFNPISGEMRYPDGTRMIYGTVNGCLLPTALIGTNGGAVTMTYRDYCEGASCVRVFRHRTALSAVRDTLGRYVTFHYYGDNGYTANPANGHPAGELAAIKAPDRSGLQQEVIRVEYQLVTLKYDFGSLAVDAPANNTQIQLVRRVYYPQTGKGFLFLDYSTYGMPRKISSRMGMTGAAGTITDGTEIAYTTYNYTTMDPSDPYGRDQGGVHLSDFPQFTRREEWWQGKTDAAGVPTTDTTNYDYSRTTDASTEVATKKYVDRNYEVATTTGNDPTQLSFGKVISVERRTSSTPQATLGKQVLTYVTGPDGEVEIEKIETFDEAGQGRLLKFGYGNYGRVSDQYECGYKQAGGYQVIRRAHHDYVDGSNYLAARFLRLVSRTSVYDALNDNNDTNDVLKAKTETVYDGYTDPAIEGIENYGLTSDQYPPNHDATYDQNKTLRGNATAVKTFSQLSPAEVSTTRHAKYDIFGNVVWAEVSCCVKKSFGFSGLTAYSEPDSIQSGDTGGLNLQTNYQYNYFTGLVENETDPDGQQTAYDYDLALRLKTVTSPTGAFTVTKFDQDGNGNDLLTYLSQTTYDDQGTQKVITSRQWSDGAGRVLRAGTSAGSAPNSYDMTAAIYDGWGRVLKRSNPYAGDADGNPQSGVTRFWTVSAYDELSRVTQVTLPDTQTTQMKYNGATTTSGATVEATDTVGRKRKSEVDGLGRLVKVTEQNPANGNLEWEAIYSYDVLNNLTQTNQGGQLRTFTYDAKSRLKSVTTPEAGTTTYGYTDFDAVSTRTDARGVVTTYTYGALNLPTGVSYNTASATGVAATAPVSIIYKSASPGKGQIEKVRDGVTDVAGSESYVYDSFGRLQSCTRVIDGISYQKQYEYNTANQMTLMIYPSGKRVNVGRDDRGRLSAVKRVDTSGAPQETYLSGINYRADGQVSAQNLGNGATESFGYSDDRLQLTSQTVTKGSNTLLSLSYGYGASAGQMGFGTTSGNNGQLVSVNGTINGQGRNQAFTYDNVGRLVTATGWGTWARRFDYDRYGNRTGVWDAVSGGNPLQNTALEQVGGIKTNRIASVNGTAFSYDASGNVIGDGVRAFTYDAENRIVSVGGPSSESYSYDAGNRRVKKVVRGVVTHTVWGGDRVIAEYERGGGATPATGTRYYHQDRLSTRVITDSAGAVVGTTNHLPFGEEIGVSGAEEKHKFTSYERDGALDYAVNRHYDPQRGRFNQVDPLGMGAASLADPQSLNLYSYVGNDPVNSVDPSGLNEHPAGVVDSGGVYCSAQYSGEECGGLSGLMSGNYGNHVAEYNRVYGGMSEEAAEGLRQHLERVANARVGNGFRTNEEVKAAIVALLSEHAESNKGPLKKLVEMGIVKTTFPLDGGASEAATLVGWLINISGAAIAAAVAIVAALAQEGDRPHTRKITLFREADATNPGAFRIDPDGVSVFEIPNPDKKYNIPFWGTLTGARVPGVTIKIDGIPGLTAEYTPTPQRPDHWSLHLPGVPDAIFKDILSRYAKEVFGKLKK